MRVRPLVAAVLLLAPFAWSCAQSQDADFGVAEGKSADTTNGSGTSATGNLATGGASSSTGSAETVAGGTTGAAETATGGSSTSGAAVAGSSTGGSPSTTGTASAAAGTIVPLYTDPDDPSWDAIIAAATAHPTVSVVAIVNPDDGPGSSKSDAYVAGIAALQAAHIKVIGYVATGYGSKSLATVDAQIDQWKSWYPNVQGIFFDEQSDDPGYVSHYQTLSQYAKSQGFGYTVGNPGTGVPAAYVGALDTMLIYESNGVPSISSLAQWADYAPSNFGIIPYDVSALDPNYVKQARQYVQYIYVQTDNLPNPWDSLPAYFGDLLAALE